MTITIYERYAYVLTPCSHDGATVTYPDGSKQCYACWSEAHALRRVHREPDLRRGLCSVNGCDRGTHGASGQGVDLCEVHYWQWAVPA